MMMSFKLAHAQHLRARRAAEEAAPWRGASAPRTLSPERLPSPPPAPSGEASRLGVPPTAGTEPTRVNVREDEEALCDARR